MSSSVAASAVLCSPSSRAWRARTVSRRSRSSFCRRTARCLACCARWAGYTRPGCPEGCTRYRSSSPTSHDGHPAHRLRRRLFVACSDSRTGHGGGDEERARARSPRCVPDDKRNRAGARALGRRDRDRVVRACYLAYLGARTLIDSRRRPADLVAGTPAAPAHAVFRQGFLSAISNPKLGVFFVTFLPQFVLPGQDVLPRLIELGVTFAMIGWLWMNVYGLFVTRLREVITAPRVRQWMQRVTGVVLLGFGARLALERV